MNRRMRTQRRSGFTLMEILLVMAILVVVASMATFAWLTIQKNAQSDAAYNEISTLSNACIQFKLRNNRFPSKLEDLFYLPQGMTKQKWGGPYLTGDVTDPWGNPYVYSADDANDLVYITSAGPDQQSGTEDDITNAPASAQGT